MPFISYPILMSHKSHKRNSVALLFAGLLALSGLTSCQAQNAQQAMQPDMILESKKSGITCIDFGRTDADNEGLLTFKNRWGAVGSPLTYVRWNREPKKERTWSAPSGTVKRVFTLMPDFVLQAAGQVLYRHVG